MGCVNTSVTFFEDGKLTARAFKSAQLAAQAEFEEVAQEFGARNWDAAYGSAGTIGAVAEIGQSLGLTNCIVTPALLKYLREMLIGFGDIRRIKIAGLKDDRREVIAGGVAVLSAVLKRSASRKCGRLPAPCESGCFTTFWVGATSTTPEIRPWPPF